MSLKLVAENSDVDKHEYDVTSLIFKNNKVYSAADDGKIKMWSIDLQLLKEIQAHPCSVYSLTCDDGSGGNLVFSCSSDGSVRSWNADTLEEVKCIEQPGNQEMWKCYWEDGVLAVANDQGVVTLYDKDGQKGTIVEMMEQIKDIAYKDHLLYTVRDLDLVVTEILPGEKKRYTCRCTLAGRAPIALVGDKLISSSRDGKDIFVNFRKENKFEMAANIKDAHNLIINALSGGVRDNAVLIYSAGWDKNVKQWRLVDGGTTPAGVVDVGGYVNALCVSDGCKNVFAGGADGKIWKLEVQ